MKISRKDVETAVYGVLELGAKSAIVFVPRKNPVARIKATRFGKIDRRCSTSADIRLTIDRPNYSERKYLKLCKRARAIVKNPWLKWDKE